MTTDSNQASATAEVPQLQQVDTPAKRSGPGRWTAFGTGVGIEIRDRELHITIVRTRPWKVAVLGAAAVADFRDRPAAEWGTELLAFLRKIGAAHIAATVLLPRRDVIVRTIHLPGVSDRDLESAIGLQIDSLHPFADEQVSFSYARLGKSPYILVGIARRQNIDTWSALFAEAGLKVASFTFSAAILYSAARVITRPPSSFVVAHESDNAWEMYGESEPRPVYSATLPVSRSRAESVARSELRLDPDALALGIGAILPKPAVFPADYDPQSARFEAGLMSYATALAGACPWLAIDGNLLPVELRRGSSRVRLIPTFALAGVLAILLTMLALQSSWADARYLSLLQHEIGRYEPTARRLESLDRNITAVRARSQSLDDFRRRSKLDMDALAEITKLIPPPGWLNSLDMDRNSVQIAGETDQAATLLKSFDNSPLFEKSEFAMPISRTTTGEMFRIRAMRETPPLVAPPAQAPPVPAPAAAQPAAPAASAAKPPAGAAK